MKKSVKYYVDHVEEGALAACIGTTVILIFVQICMRYIFNQSLSWSEELARYLFVWESWLGIGLGVKYRKHIQVEMFANKLSDKNRFYLGWIVDIILMIILIYLIVQGSVLVVKMYNLGTVSPALRIPMAYVYASAPVGCIIMALRIISQRREAK